MVRIYERIWELGVSRDGDRRNTRMTPPHREPAEKGERDCPAERAGPPGDWDALLPRQVGEERVEFAVGSRGEQELKPLLKLSCAEPALGGRASQPLGNLVPIGI